MRPLRAAAADHVAARARAHPGPKPVGAGALALLRLPGPLHRRRQSSGRAPGGSTGTRAARIARFVSRELRDAAGRRRRARMYGRSGARRRARRPTSDDLWRRVRDELEASLPGSTFNLWLEPLRAVSSRARRCCCSAPPGGPRPGSSAVTRRRSREALAPPGTRASRDVAFVDRAGRRGEPTSAAQRHESLPLDPGHTFDRFVIGPRQPARPRRGARGRRAPGRGLQPALPPRPAGARQDPPARARSSSTCAATIPSSNVHYTTAERFTTEFVGALRRDGPGAVQGPLSRARRAADRRRPGARGQAAHRGGVRPHLQHPATPPASRSCSPATARPRRSRSSPSGCATASTGACGSSSSRPTCAPGSRCSGGSPPTPGRELPEPARPAGDRDPRARATCACSRAR